MPDLSSAHHFRAGITRKQNRIREAGSANRTCGKKRKISSDIFSFLYFMNLNHFAPGKNSITHTIKIAFHNIFPLCFRDLLYFVFFLIIPVPYGFSFHVPDIADFNGQFPFIRDEGSVPCDLPYSHPYPRPSGSFPLPHPSGK